MTNVQHAKYRHRLPQLDGGLFLTDGGLETTLIYHDGFDLPMFAAFTLIESERGRAALRAYYAAMFPWRRAAATDSFWKARPGAPIPTGAPSSVSRDRLAAVNRAAIDMLREIRAAYETKDATRDQRSHWPTR